MIGSNAQTGQTGYLFEVEGTALQPNAITLGSNIQFAGDTNYYTVTGITDEDTVNGYAPSKNKSNKQMHKQKEIMLQLQASLVTFPLTDTIQILVQVILLQQIIPNTSSISDLTRETDETNGGRVYYVGTDQSGNFRVGEYFKVDQATGTATLNADAFDLSGPTELQLGSIGAQLGATINEFSIDSHLQETG